MGESLVKGGQKLVKIRQNIETWLWGKVGGSGSPLSLKKSGANQNSLDSWEPWDNFWNPKMKIWVDYAYWRRKSSNNFAWTLRNDFWTDQLSEVLSARYGGWFSRLSSWPSSRFNLGNRTSRDQKSVFGKGTFGLSLSKCNYIWSSLSAKLPDDHL